MEIILQLADLLPGKEHKQTGYNDNESTLKNRETVGSCVFCGPRRERYYATAR
jgi:hypothetical protein